MEHAKIVEEVSYEFLLREIKDERQKQRIKLNLEYYIRNANKYKKCDSICSVILVILPALATLVSCAVMRFPDTNGVLDIMVPVITACASVTAGVSGALKFKDRKIGYRDYAENIKNILISYACEKGEFLGLDSVKRDELLFERCEQIIMEGYKRLGNIEKNSGSSQNYS